MAALLAPSPPLWSEEVHLTLDPIKLTNGEFRFRPLPPEVVPHLPTTLEQANAAGAAGELEMGLTQTYELLIDVNEIQPKSGCDYFAYDFYAHPRTSRPKTSAASSRILRFPMKGWAVGALQDDRAEATFSLGTESGTILIPIFGCEANLLTGPAWKDPVDVNFHDGISLTLHLRNQLPRLSVFLRPPFPRVKSLHDQYWKDTRIDLDDPTHDVEIPRGSDSGDAVRIRIVPRTATAFITSLFSLAKKTADDHLSVRLNYRTKGGMLRPLDVDIPVRFVPWPPLLFAALVAGCIVGAVISAVIRQQSNWARNFKDLALAVLLASVVEALAMVLAAHDSQLRILGFDLDPWQLLPAALIGSLVGLMGFEGAKSLVGAILKAKPMEEAKSDR